MALTRGSRGEHAYPPVARGTVREWGRRTLSFSGDLVNRLRARSSTPPRVVGQKPGGMCLISARTTAAPDMTCSVVWLACFLCNFLGLSIRERDRLPFCSGQQSSVPVAVLRRPSDAPGTHHPQLHKRSTKGARTPTYADEQALCAPRSRAPLALVPRVRIWPAPRHSALELWGCRAWPGTEEREAVGAECAFA